MTGARTSAKVVRHVTHYLHQLLGLLLSTMVTTFSLLFTQL
jgi:hypothetical protein